MLLLVRVALAFVLAPQGKAAMQRSGSARCSSSCSVPASELLKSALQGF